MNGTKIFTNGAIFKIDTTELPKILCNAIIITSPGHLARIKGTYVGRTSETGRRGSAIHDM